MVDSYGYWALDTNPMEGEENLSTFTRTTKCQISHWRPVNKLEN